MGSDMCIVNKMHGSLSCILEWCVFFFHDSLVHDLSQDFMLTSGPLVLYEPKLYPVCYPAMFTELVLPLFLTWRLPLGSWAHCTVSRADRPYGSAPHSSYGCHFLLVHPLDNSHPGSISSPDREIEMCIYLYINARNY